MKRFLLTTLTLFLLAGACTDDAPVLWQIETEGDDPFEPPMIPPEEPPDLPLCGPEPELEGPCICHPGELCMCGEPGMEDPSPEPICNVVCEEGGCEIICASPNPCETECTEGCHVQCDPGSFCTLGCAQGCTMVCEEGAHCQLWSYEGPSQMLCLLGALCECPLEANCECMGSGCPPP